MNDNKTYTVAEAESQGVEEVWRAIPGVEAYEASTRGRLRSITHLVIDTRGRRQRKTGKLLKPTLSVAGYHVVGMGRVPKIAQLFVHRVVAKTFIPNPAKLPEINHKNGVKTDNQISNLEWISTTENQRHRRRILNKNTFARKLRADDAVDIRILRSFGATLSGIAKAYDITRAHASSISRGVNWSKL